IIFNPGAFILGVIKCACTDTFQAEFPQCVDRYSSLPGVADGIRKICSFRSALSPA
ncbi:hypothetical protein BYT27DRAFT_7076085, partial [Phlegmacium glaucopus]